MCKQCESVTSKQSQAQSAKPELESPQLLPCGQYLIPFWGYELGYNAPKIAIRDKDGNEILVKCSKCEELHSPDELVEHSQSDDKLCEDCRCQCEDCDEVFSSDDDDMHSAYDSDSCSRNRSERSLCSECSWECADCNERFYGDGSTNDNDKKICCRCSEHYSCCESCSCVVHEDNTVYIESDGCSYCESCGDDRQAEIDAENEDTDDDTESDTESPVPRSIPSSLIRPYRHKPSPIFSCAPHQVGEHCPKEFFGIELECENEDTDSHDDAIRSSGIADDKLFYCKRDGSLADDGLAGFEIVSHPATLAYWLEKDLSFAGKLASSGYSTGENCGLHIHVSRTLSAPQIAKLLLFTKKNADFMRFLSRRIDAELSFCKLEISSIGGMIRKATGEGEDRRMENRRQRYEDFNGADRRNEHSNRRQGRYVAVNLANEDTIEFRLFQSTLDADEIRQNIAIVASLMAFIRQASLARLSAQDYRSYIALHGRKLLGSKLNNQLLERIGSFESATDCIAA